MEYDPQKIESKWQEKWEKDKIFEVKEDPKKEKYYVLEMYPYPSGALHMGHLRNYTIGDCFARFKRMNGFNVLYPMGYDSFGMPAENAAIDEGADPREWTDHNIDIMRQQQKQLGLSYDWNRELWSHQEDYYKFDQWFFLKMYEKGLAYQQESYVNWCPKCATVLANEQAQGGKCWRCNNVVDVILQKTWFLKARDYAEELLTGLDIVEWPEKVKIMQRNWIGRSEGTIIKFPIIGEDRTIDIFTTRPDTLYGVTFMVFAPEHPWVRKWVQGTEYEKDFEKLYEEVTHQDRFERTDLEIEKKGLFIGKYALNPMTKEEVPIYLGNFVIYEYGAGAVMAVPAHDQRDFEFAKEFNIPIVIVIQPHDFELNVEKMIRAFESKDGILVNSEEFNGIEATAAIHEITKKLEKMKSGNATINYKLRDWGISRQRYWGCPIPIIYCDKCGVVPVPEKDLPVVLPTDVTFTKGGNPLETSESFTNTTCPKCGANARREMDTMDTFVDSSWYFFGFCRKKPYANDVPYRKEIADYWGKDKCLVDQYIGGIEHAILHLIYARFWTKVARDLGIHDFDEPFKRLLTQGMINKVHPYCEKCERFLMKAELESMTCKQCSNKNLPLKSVKMSKSYGNTVSPEEIVGKFGADAARFFILFGAAPDSGLEWSDDGVGFANRFMQRIFQLFTIPTEKTKKEKTVRDTLMIYYLNKTIKGVSEALQKISIREAVNYIIQFTNDLIRYKSEEVNKKIYDECIEKLALMLHPIVPHITEEVWEKLGMEGYLSLASWPTYDNGLITRENEFKWKLMNRTIDDINSIKQVVKLEKINGITLIIASEWKYKFYSELMILIATTRNQGEIMKEIMKDPELKPHGKNISQTVAKVLKNVGKFSEISLTQNEELQFFTEIKPIIEKKFKCPVDIPIEEDSKVPKASQALPGRPAIKIS
jgi:leucyl-tRNA synthetase